MQKIEKAGPVQYPWVHAWGGLNMGNITAGTLFPFVSESAAFALASLALAVIPWPARAGIIRHLTVRFRSSALAVDSTWTVFVGGAATPLVVTVPAGQIQRSITLDTPVPLIASVGNTVHPQFTTPALPGSVSTRPCVIIEGNVFA